MYEARRFGSGGGRPQGGIQMNESERAAGEPADGADGRAETGSDIPTPVEVPTGTVNNARVLIDEYCWLNPNKPRPADLDAYFRETREKQAALCLSGGGIRSAAFALGVLQALSRKRLLTDFHFLSTVSGGGYIGSFIQRWINDAPGGATDVMNALEHAEEKPQITRLRQNSNFITPRIGLASNDTWTAVAMSLRNIVVNWFLFLPMLLLVALLPNLFLSSVDSVPNAVEHFRWFDEVLIAVAGIAIAVSVANTVPLLASYRRGNYDDLGGKIGKSDVWLFVRVVLPILVWAVSGTLALAADLLETLVADSAAAHKATDGARLAAVTLGAMLAGFAVAAGRVSARKLRIETLRKDLVVWPLSFIAAAAWVYFGAWLFNLLAPVKADPGWAAALLTTLGPLWLMSATLVGAIVFAAFRLAEGEGIKPDSDRELIARISAIKFKPMLAWALAGFSALLLSSILRDATGQQDLTISSLVALVAGGGAVAGGRSENSGSMVKGAGSKLLRFLPLSAMVAIATLLFIVALLALLGGLEDRLAALIERPIGGWLLPHREWLGWIDPMVAAHLTLAAVLVYLLWHAGGIIPVNRFSLNGFYRNRLARAFLGAAREQRDPNPFTGFDSGDNIRMHRLRPADEPHPQKPRKLYPVVNCALNVTATDNLAWQERKAEPFIFTPLFSGSGMLNGAEGAYVSSTIYGGSERDLALGGETKGVSVATAISISGAAASPNMGYHSSPATAFLMTLFNVRLGAWLPNPARSEPGDDPSRSGPTNSAMALLRELSGSTNDTGPDVYLSDGGHFENLGVYEMLRRRCRYIMVTDAGADPTCGFSDLGGLVRKAKIDFDCRIDFGRMCISERGKDIESQLAWAIGNVVYQDGTAGTILYVKPSYFGQALPVDVVAYAKASETFPHETTADQFFSESQFESYRRLGHYLSGSIGPDSALPGDRKVTDVASFFEAASNDYRDKLKTPE
jgi:hypothetical protein